MKFTYALPLVIGLASAFVPQDPRLTKHRRQEDSNEVNIGAACRTHDMNEWETTCGVMSTYNFKTDLIAALLGNFNMITGDYLIHLFDGDCNHLDSKNAEPQSPRFKATMDLDGWDVDVGVACYGVACAQGDMIGSMWVEGKWDSWNGDDSYHCWDDEQWTEDIGAYSYRFCEFAC